MTRKGLYLTTFLEIKRSIFVMLNYIIKMRKIKILKIIIIIASCLFVVVINKQWNKEKIYILYDKCSFSDYEIKDDKVFINCELFIFNSYNSETYIELAAFDNDDVNIGLLKNSELKGYIKDTNNYKFLLKKGENCFTVSFIGEFAGKAKKANRMLPNKIVVYI